MIKNKLFIGYMNPANAVTLAGLVLSLGSIFVSFVGKIPIAICLLIGAGIADLFDGLVARRIKRTDAEKAFGIQLDTLVDVISFGVAPILISCSWGGINFLNCVVYVWYLICAVMRLAYFNSNTATEGGIAFYYGLPVTYMALLLPIVLLFKSTIINTVLFALVGLLYILRIKVPKPKGIWYLLFPLLAVIVIGVWCFI